MIPNDWMTYSAVIGAFLYAVGGVLTGQHDIMTGVGIVIAALGLQGSARKWERIAKSNEEGVKLEKEVAVQVGVSRNAVEFIAPNKEK